MPQTRLVTGDGNFSYTEALEAKHPEISESIVTTAYESKKDLVENYGGETKEERNILEARIHSISQKSKVLFGVDATKLHENQEFKGQHFKRIHFNFPHDGKEFEDKSRVLPDVVKQFFASASELQKEGDQIHMALPKGWNPEDELRRQGYGYGIYEASSSAGYLLIKVRKFDTERYPQYQHRIINKAVSAPISATGREYIFVKTSFSKEKIDARHKARDAIRQYTPQAAELAKGYTPGIYNCLEALKTDNDSSDYEDNKRDSKKSTVKPVDDLKLTPPKLIRANSAPLPVGTANPKKRRLFDTEAASQPLTFFHRPLSLKRSISNQDPRPQKSATPTFTAG